VISGAVEIVDWVKELGLGAGRIRGRRLGERTGGGWMWGARLVDFFSTDIFNITLN
jgi:hypothetical protein